jgi:hypothetical protein
MTNATFSHRAASRTRDRYSFRSVAQMEWRKLGTVRRSRALGRDPRGRPLRPTWGCGWTWRTRW